MRSLRTFAFRWWWGVAVVLGSLPASAQFANLSHPPAAALAAATGAVTDAQVPNNITVDLAAACTALASNPAACSGVTFVSDIAANGTLTCGTPLDSGAPLASRTVALDSTADQSMSVVNATSYTIERAIVTGCTGTPVLAAGGVYTGASKTGITVVAAAQVYTALTASAKFLPLTLEAVTGTDVFTAQTLHFSLSVANAAAVTCSLYVFGRRLP